MYKVGDKFIIEIGEEYESEFLKTNIEADEEQEESPVNLYRIRGFNSLVFDEKGLDRLEKAENLERLAYDRGYSKAENDYFKQTEVDAENTMQAGYEKGLSDAWECMKKILYMTVSEQKEAFGVLEFSVDDILRKTSPQEAIDKLKVWEEKQEIKVGDAVDYGNILIVVTYMNKENGTFSGIDANGESYVGRRLSDCKKTGKHIDLTEIFKGLEEENAD